MRKWYLVIVLLLTCLSLGLGLPTSPLSQEAKHPKIVLKGFDGNPLTLESKAPYSPRKTCGGCHDYARITNGYHFQQGRTEGTGKVVISDAFNPKFPWNLSSGMFGKHGGVSLDSSQLAGKANGTPSSIDKSSFYYVQNCGACHPGGGWGEYDRNGNFYYSEETGKFGNEPLETGFLLDGDYTPYTRGDFNYGAPWNKSGVSEADCLICHLKGYQWKERAATLRDKHFKYGATVGAGWAMPKRAPEDPENPEGDGRTVDFTRKEVADFENLHLQIVRKTPDENCWACHESPDGKQRGRRWDGETDVHKAKGLTCLSCHPSDKEHNLAKGNSVHQTVRDDLDNTMPSCEDCHYRGRDRKAPRYRHPFSPRHMKRIACQTCHLSSQAAADLVYDLASTGTPVVYDTTRFLSSDPLDPRTPLAGTDPGLWTPSLKDFGGRIVPVKSLIVISWGDLDEKTNVARPIPLWRVRAIQKPTLKDDDGDGIPEVNSTEEIKAYLKALRANDAFGNPVAKHPVLIKGNFLYQLDKKGEVEKIRHEQAEPLDLSLSHNVRSGQSVIGARGCRDCHSKNSPFFLRRLLSDPFDESGKPAYIQGWERMGIDKEKLGRLLLEQ